MLRSLCALRKKGNQQAGKAGRHVSIETVKRNKCANHVRMINDDSGFFSLSFDDEKQFAGSLFDDETGSLARSLLAHLLFITFLRLSSRSRCITDIKSEIES